MRIPFSLPDSGRILPTGIEDAFSPLSRGGSGGLKLSDVASFVLDAIELDFPDFDSDISKHNSYYFFADAAGFIAATILDPAMLIGGMAIKCVAGVVGNALGFGAGVNKLNKAAKVTAVIGKADNAAKGKYIVQYVDEVGKLIDTVGDASNDLKKLENVMSGANRAITKLGPKADVLKNADALKLLGKSDEIGWTGKRIDYLNDVTKNLPQKHLDDLSDAIKVDGCGEFIEHMGRTLDPNVGKGARKIGNGDLHNLNKAADKAKDIGAENVAMAKKFDSPLRQTKSGKRIDGDFDIMVKNQADNSFEFIETKSLDWDNMDPSRVDDFKQNLVDQNTKYSELIDQGGACDIDGIQMEAKDYKFDFEFDPDASICPGNPQGQFGGQSSWTWGDWCAHKGIPY